MSRGRPRRRRRSWRASPRTSRCSTTRASSPSGYTPVFHCHTAQVACEFTELLKRLDPKTGQVAEENPQTLKTGDAAVVQITPKRPLVIEKYKEFPQLGRFAIRDMGQTVAAGVVVDVKKRE